MGKVTQSPIDREEARPRRKRRKKDLDRMHSKILRARRTLDVGKGENKAGQKRQNQTKICNRLLPEPAAGIYRNGAKGKDIQKAEAMENTFYKARLKADALKLFNGDTHGSKCIVEIPIHDKTTKQSPNKDYMKNNLEWIPCILEQSPVLGKRASQNQKPYLIKKKGEENIFEDTNSKIEKNINDESRHGQKEDICKRRLFQNEQLETTTTTSTTSSTQMFDNTNFIKENKTNEKEIEQMCSKNSEDSSCTLLSSYMKFCRIISAENFEKDILQNISDPVTTTIKKLRHTYANSFRQQLLRKKNKQELENVESAYSVEYQACTFSDISQLSPVEFEVPKCSKNHIIADRLQEDLFSQNDKFHLMKNAELKRSDDITRYSSTSCSSRNTFQYNTNNSIENCENNNMQRLKQSKDIRQFPKSMNFYFMNDKDSIQLDSQKNSNHVSHLSKSKRHDKDCFLIDVPNFKNSQYIDSSKHLEIPFFSDSIFSKRQFLKDSHDKLPIADNCAPNNVSEKRNSRITNKCNEKNVKRIPTILRRYSNITNYKPNDSVQITGDYTEGLYKKYETATATFPNVLENFSTSNTMNAIFDQTKVLEPQIGLMKIKDSQESQGKQFDINMQPKEHNGFYRSDDSLYPRTFETSCNTNSYSEKLAHQEQISPDIKNHVFHSNNYRPINYLLRGVNFSNSNVEPTKEFPQQNKFHMCETKQPPFRKDIRNHNENIHFNNVNDRTMPMPVLNLSQNIQIEKRSTESRQQMFDKTDVEYAKNQINQNACCYNEQYIYFDSANCQRKCKKQAHYFKETDQSKNLYDIRGYNNIDNCVNLSSTIQNIPLLSLKQENNLSTHPKAIDDQHRAVLLQNTQPVKYLAVKNGSDIQRIPVYIDDKSVKVAENVPLKIIALMDSSIQTKAFPQEIATQVPLQTNNLHFNDFATRKISDQSFVKHLDSVNSIVFNPDSQSNIWYASNL